MSTTATRRAPERVARLTAVRTPALPREFPVRFNPIPGMAALLGRPHNSFRWVGAGTVRVDERGVYVTAKRLTPLGLRRSARLITGTELRQVYREGDSIRIDLHTAEEGACSFRFWAVSTHSAAEIVRVLPTSRTIELEGANGSNASNGTTHATSRDFGGITWWIALLVTTGTIVVAAFVWMALARSPVTQQTQPALPPPVPVAQLGDTHVGTPGVGSPQALADLEKFTPRFDALTAQFATAFDALQRGSLSQQQFADGLEKWLLPQWDALAAQLPAEPDARDPRDPPLRAVADSWRRALPVYVHGLRTNDYREVLQAFGYIRDAEGYQKESQAMLTRLTDR